MGSNRAGVIIGHHSDGRSIDRKERSGPPKKQGIRNPIFSKEDRKSRVGDINPMIGDGELDLVRIQPNSEKDTPLSSVVQRPATGGDSSVHAMPDERRELDLKDFQEEIRRRVKAKFKLEHDKTLTRALLVFFPNLREKTPF
jgi:hypothetical protein